MRTTTIRKKILDYLIKTKDSNRSINSLRISRDLKFSTIQTHKIVCELERDGEIIRIKKGREKIIKLK